MSGLGLPIQMLNGPDCLGCPGCNGNCGGNNTQPVGSFLTGNDDAISVEAEVVPNENLEGVTDDIAAIGKNIAGAAILITFGFIAYKILS